MESDDAHEHWFCDLDLRGLGALVEIEVLVDFDVEVVMELIKVLA